MSTHHLYVAICQGRGDGLPRHWVLMVHEVGSQQAIWYHSTGGPTQGRQYEVVIQPKRFDSRGIEKHYFLCDISPSRLGKLKAAAQRTPPMNCQQWVVDVLRDLEVRSGLVPQGTSNQCDVGTVLLADTPSFTEFQK